MGEDRREDGVYAPLVRAISNAESGGRRPQHLCDAPPVRAAHDSCSQRRAEAAPPLLAGLSRSEGHVLQCTLQVADFHQQLCAAHRHGNFGRNAQDRHLRGGWR